jgi:hypothetical protein
MGYSTKRHVLVVFCGGMARGDSPTLVSNTSECANLS